MRICVAHETLYRYDTPCTGVIQTLRLTPRNHAGQYVVDWRIEISADCRLEADEDAFGNLAHAFSASGPISELRVMVEGEVETQDTAGVVRGAVERGLLVKGGGHAMAAGLTVERGRLGRFMADAVGNVAR